MLNNFRIISLIEGLSFLVLLFVGFCALLVVAQLLPAVMNLIGMTKDAAKKSSKYSNTASVKK